MTGPTRIGVVMSMSVWATPAHGQTLEELCVAVRAAGNTILMVDGENRRVLIARYHPDEETGEK